MVLPVDTSGITGIKTLRDFNVENTLKNQAMAEGDIKNANAANLYRTQVLTGAIASGNQDIYNQARAHLADRGIDVSDLAPDLATGSQQVNAMRQAQYSANPINALLGLGLKGDQAVAAATATMGNAEGGRALVPTAAAVADRANNILGGSTRPPSLPAAPAGVGGVVPARGEPMPAPGAVAQALDGLVSGQQPAAPVAQQVPQMPQRGAMETQASYEARPDVMMAKARAQKVGEKSGEEVGDVAKALNVSTANLPSMMKRMSDVIKNSDNASYGGGVNNEGDGYAQEYANTAMGQYFEPGRAQSNELMGKALAQGVLPEIGSALSQSNLKGNKFLEGLFNDALSIKMTAPNDVKKQLAAKNIEMYVSTTKAMAAHARELGQPAPTDDEIDAAVAKYAKEYGIDNILAGSPGKRLPGESSNDWQARMMQAAGGKSQQPADASGGWSYGGVVK